MITIAIQKTLQSPQGMFLLDIDLTIEKGSFISISGKSGAGKTSLLKMLSGLLTPDLGLIRVGDRSWFSSDQKINISPQERQTGFVFQDYALFPNMTVKQNLTFANRGRESGDLADEIMDAMRILFLADRKPSTLSGGQQQRVALARALMRKPSLLLLDEPFASLDSETSVVLQDLVVSMHKRFGLTTLLVSHNTSDVYRLSDEVVTMEQGRIVKQGKVHEVFHHHELSGKVQLTGQVIKIVPADCLFILYAACGNQVVKVVITEREASRLKPADKVLISSKAFNPVVVKIT